MNEKLQEIKEEDLIVFIYFILLFVYLYANRVEEKYIIYGDERNREKYRLLLYVVFGVSFLITLYYSVESINNLNNSSKEEVYNLKWLSTVANLLILIATGIYLYIIYKDKNIDIEVSP